MVALGTAGPGCTPFVALDEEAGAEVDAPLVWASLSGWSLTAIEELDPTTHLPTSLFSRPLRLHSAGLGLTTGVYSCLLNAHWFALLRVANGESVWLLVAPQVFSKVCDRLSRRIQRDSPTRPLTPMQTQTQASQARVSLRVRPVNSFTDRTISLSGWMASQEGGSPRLGDRGTRGSEETKEENKRVCRCRAPVSV